MAQTFYVNTASSGGDGTTNATSGTTAAFASLSDAQTNISDKTIDTIINCCGATADTTAVNLTGWTGALTVQANRSDAAGFYGGNDLISTAHYRLVTSGSSQIQVSSTGVIIDGIQFESGGTSFAQAIRLSNNNGVTVRKCRFRATAATAYGIGSSGSALAGSGTMQFENNVIVGYANGMDLFFSSSYAPTYNLLNNTIYGNGGISNGINIRCSGTAGGDETFNIKGNAIANTSAGANINTTGVTGSPAYTYENNATADADGTRGDIDIVSAASAWTSPGTTQSADFTIKDANSALYDIITAAYVTTDIQDQYRGGRGGSSADIGAFESPLPYSLIGSDDFTADGGSNTNLGSHTPSGLNALASGWSDLQWQFSTSSVVEAGDDSLCQPYYVGNDDWHPSVIGPTAQAAQHVDIILGSNATFKEAAILLASNAATYWNGYLGVYNGGAFRWQIYKITDGTAALLAGEANFTVAAADGDTLTFKVDASGNFDLLHNGVSRITATDTTFTTGQPGIALKKSFTAGGINSFSVYDMAAAGGGGGAAPYRQQPIRHR